MTVDEIISGLQFTVDMFLFDPTTGKTYTEPRNDMDKTTIDACNGAIELLKSHKQVIEDIKDEINRKANSGQWSEAVIYGMQKALFIIDKHTSGKDGEE